MLNQSEPESYPEWCMVSFVDEPAQMWSGHYSHYVTTQEASSAAKMVAGLLDTTGAKLIINRNAKRPSNGSLDCAVATAYVASVVNGRVNSDNLAALRMLQPLSSKHPRDIPTGIADLALARLTKGYNSRGDLLQSVIDSEVGANLFLSLSATRAKIELLLSDGRTTEAVHLANEGQKRYAKLGRWRNFNFLVLTSERRPVWP